MGFKFTLPPLFNKRRHGNDCTPVVIYKILVAVSLGVVIGILAITMVLSVRSAPKKADV